MNKIFLTIFCILSFNNSSLSQSRKFTVNGEIDNVKKGKISIYLKQFAKNGITEFAFHNNIVKNKFKVSGNIDEPAEALIVINDSILSNSFYIEPGVQKAKLISKGRKYQLSIEGSKTNFDYLTKYEPMIQKFEDNSDMWYEKYWDIEKKYDGNIPVKIKDSLETIRQKLKSQKDTAIVNYFITNQKSYVGLLKLAKRIYDLGYNSAYEKALNQAAPFFKYSRTYKNIVQLSSQSKKSAIGTIFPEIAVANIDKRIKSIKQMLPTGKLVLIDFWFSNCLPCIRQFPDLKNIWDKYRDRFEIIGVSVDKTESVWLSSIKANQILWSQYLDKNGKAASKLLVHFYPSNFLLDQNQKIIAKNLEPHEIEKYLTEIIK